MKLGMIFMLLPQVFEFTVLAVVLVVSGLIAVFVPRRVLL